AAWMQRQSLQGRIHGVFTALPAICDWNARTPPAPLQPETNEHHPHRANLKHTNITRTVPT
ncbi:hypothetical protein, partial [Pantoea sp. A4]|uniref:hypothetical protein n=1 Tax=Pantoea sp. A4 TaxID=1225184 RepID=UPI001ED9ACD6